jgi:alpha-L-arabinofuranosidase
VNSAAETSALIVSVANARVGADARVTTLTSASPTDENTFDEPAKIAPKTTALRVPASSFTHEFPPYSLTVMRIKEQGKDK